MSLHILSHALQNMETAQKCTMLRETSAPEAVLHPLHASARPPIKKLDQK